MSSMKKKEEESSATCSNYSGENGYGAFKRWLVSFCGLGDIDIITQFKSSVWQYGDPPSPSPPETTRVVSICKYDLIHIYSKWHSYQNRSFRTRDKGQTLATTCVPRGWFSRKSPEGLFPYQGQNVQVQDPGTCFPSSRWQKGLSAMWNLLRGEGLPDRDREDCLNLLSGRMVCNPFMLVSLMPL